MLTRIACPNCGHVGATDAASLPRVLICSQCGHAGLIRSGRPARSPTVTREEQAAEHAALTRYEAEAE
jgi:ribosomal protein L32